MGEIAHVVLLPLPDDADVLSVCQRVANDPNPCSFGPADALLRDPVDPSDIELPLVVEAVAPGQAELNETMPGTSLLESRGFKGPVFR